MLQLLHPFFGDLMFDGIGLLGCVFVLGLMRDAWKDWKQAGVMRVRRRNRLPDSTGRRRFARGFFRKFRGKLILLVVASSVAVMLVGGRQNPHGGKASPATATGTSNPATDSNPPRGRDSAYSDQAILTYQTLPPPRGAGDSIVNGNSNGIASYFRTSPDATNGALNHP